MERIQYNVVERDTKNASGKAKVDVTKILSKYGFKKMYNPSSLRFIRVLQQLLEILRLKKDCCVFVQYPANIDLCYKVLAKKKCKKVVIIHDIESLLGVKTLEKEMRILSMFDLIISHNPKMTAYLLEKGIKTKIVNLNIFDYLMSEKFSVIKEYDRTKIAFAGNLGKGKFLFDLNKIADINFLIYGSEIYGMERITQQKNVEYKGVFASDKLLEVIEGGWGLVWDGDSLDTCTGTTGEYMRYNCPHKVSMYIVAERPIIIWSEAAIAEYIVKHGLGISVQSLEEVPRAIMKITEREYKEMLSNIRQEKEQLIEGRILGSIIEKDIIGKFC